MAFSSPITRFDKAGYYFIGLILVVILGFWPTYFGKFFDDTAEFNFYFHFHAITASLWVFSLIAQPILIRRGNYKRHRQIGKFSYLLMPLIFISVLLLAHHRSDPASDSMAFNLWFPLKDLIILGTMYGIAVKYRKRMAIHARGMIVAGMVLIEPALSRFIAWAFIGMPAAYLITIFTVYAILIILIFLERDHKEGRWIFPLALGMFFMVHSVIVFELRIGVWESFARWFVSLPLT